MPNPYTYPNTILREQQANVEPGFWGLLACGLSLAVRGYQPALQTAISHGRLRSLRSLHLSVSAPDHQGKVGCRYLRARLCSSSLLVHNFSIRRLNNRVHHQWASLQSMSAEPFLFRFVPLLLWVVPADIATLVHALQSTGPSGEIHEITREGTGPASFCGVPDAAVH